jgi:rhodanese-related sulfurtransferase
MAPLVPDFVSNEISILSALLVGMAFGYVLEQAGFSSARRLAGLFYGYDFTVLRVFFTAAVTAIAGTLLLGYAGLLDLDAVYVNPTFLWPAVVGGIVMGLGFVLGGYCPGTGVCAAAVGKKDALVFVAGGFLGVLGYGELYPAISGFVNGSALGPIRVYDSLGLTRGAFVLLLFAAAVLAFAATSWIERRVQPDAPSAGFPRGAHRLAAAGALLLGVLLLRLPDRKTQLLAQVGDAEYQRTHAARYMDAEELAFRLLDRDPKLLIVDVRPTREFERMPLPASVNVAVPELFGREWAPVLGRRHATRVFVDEDGGEALRGALLAERLGYDDVRVLRGGLAGLRRTILEATDEPSTALLTPAEADARRFHAEVRAELPRLVAEARGQSSRPKPLVKAIKGGCS